LKTSAQDAKSDSALADEIKRACDKFDATLDAELQLRKAYVITQKRFNLTDLLEKPQNLFADGAYGELPKLCQFDFAEAGQCIAFARPTAAAFHTMRGAEGTLRHFYMSIVARGRVARLMWHDMVEHLRKRRDAPPKPLLDHLDNIRSNFRNPTQHPEARYDMDEAQDLLSVTIEAVNRMIRDLRSRST
jgi:hypothetical protein